MTVKLDQSTGTYYVHFSYRDAAGEKKWRKKRGFKLKRDALRWEQEEIVRVQEKVALEKISLPAFRDVAEMFLKNSGAAPGTQDMKRTSYKKYFSDHLDTPVDKITKEDLLHWRLWLADQPIKTSTKNFQMTYVRQVFRFASEIYDVPNTGRVLKAFPKTDDEINHEMQVWTIDEFNTFLEAVSRPLYRLFFEFVFWTGVRRGEAVALMKDCVSEDGYVTICRSLRIDKYGIRPTKNKKNRTIKLDSKTFADIQPLLAEPGPYLFGGETHMPVESFRDEIKRACKAAGVKQIRLHDFRHSHVSILYDHGVSTKAIAERIGDTEQQVMKTYKHLMQNQEEKMNAVIEQLHTG